MAKIYLIRHGQTGWNKGEVFRGRKDIPLDETGFAQVKAAGLKLKNEPLTQVWSSPLIRAVQTAHAVADPHKLEVRLNEELIDFNFGKWEGKTLKSVGKSDPENLSAWLNEPTRR